MLDGPTVSFWSRWPDETDGPLWAGLHVAERDGRATVVGVEIFSEPPGAARASLGPTDGLRAPRGLRAADLAALRVDELRRRLRDAGDPEATEIAGDPAQGRPTLYLRSHFEQVAGIYLRERATGGSRPILEICDRWHVSRSTAKRWVARCRVLGLLEPVSGNSSGN